MEEQTRQPKGQSETVWITGHVNTTMLYSAELWPLTISHKKKAGYRTSQVSMTTLGYYMERQSAQWRVHTKSDETTKNGRHHQGKKIKMAGTCVAHARRQDTKASHTMANGLMHQKSRKAKIELDWHRISRFEVNWHGMGRCRASSSRQRRLVRTCGPMCLRHGLN